MKSALIFILLFLMLGSESYVWADARHLKIFNHPVPLFRLSLNDYEIKSDAVMRAEMGQGREEIDDNTMRGNSEQGLLEEGSEVITIENKEAESAVENQNTSSAEVPNPKNFYTIPQLNQSEFTSGTYETDGYVVFVYHCECPKDAVCKPCMDNNIIISANNIPKTGYYLTSDDLVVFSSDLKPFELGQKYRFIIQILDVKSTAQKLNNIKLIYYRKIES